jgi:hypothetical protein
VGSKSPPPQPPPPPLLLLPLPPTTVLDTFVANEDDGQLQLSPPPHSRGTHHTTTAFTAAAASAATCDINNHDGGLHSTLPNGTRVLTRFDGVHYRGEVVSYNKKRQWYKVRYATGTRKEVDLHESFMAGLGAGMADAAAETIVNDGVVVMADVVADGVADAVADAIYSDPTLRNVTKEEMISFVRFRDLGAATEERDVLRAEVEGLRAENDRQDRALVCVVCLDRRPNQRLPESCGHIFCGVYLSACWYISTARGVSQYIL